MRMNTSTTNKRTRRHGRIRSRVSGTSERPRLAVFRSNKFIYAQLIDDQAAITIAATSDNKEKTGTKLERAAKVGEKIAELAKGKNITRVVFDRGGFLYAGRVKALAEAARAKGLEF